MCANPYKQYTIVIFGIFLLTFFKKVYTIIDRKYIVQKEGFFMNLLKEKLKQGKTVIGAHISLNDPAIADIMASVGNDFIWVDTEHSAIDYATLQNHLIAVSGQGVPTLVRACWTNMEHVKRVLEQGPDAILFPYVETAEDADRLVRACIFPPVGTRGFGPVRALRYGLTPVDDFANGLVENVLRLIQIESYKGVKNLPEMVKNPYIDGFILGPNDLAGSIGKINRVFDSEVQALIDEAIKIAHDAGKPIGVSTASTDPEILTFWYEKGCDIISAGTDFEHVREGAMNCTKTLRGILENPRKSGNGIDASKINFVK